MIKFNVRILKQLIVLGIASVVLLSCNYSAKNEVSPIQQKLDELVKRNEIPGANFSMIHQDGSVENYSSGYTDTLAKTALTKDHLMFSGSIGKTYAVAILMQLVEEGKVDLDRLFINYFDDVDWLNKLPNINEITVKMLLQHQSGLPRYVLNKGVWDSVAQNPDKVWTYKDRFSFIFDSEPIHEPDKAWAYSDSNYLLIGMLIEKITNSNYYDEVKRRLLKPHELLDTHPAIKRNFENLSNGYSSNDMFGIYGSVVKDGLFLFNPQMEWTGGGIISTAEDLARWAKIYYEANSFSSESLTEIITPSAHGKNIAENLSCGMGSFIYETKLGKAYGHAGTMPGYNSIFTYFPDQNLAVALQVNCDYASKKMGLINYVEEILSKKLRINSN